MRIGVISDAHNNVAALDAALAEFAARGVDGVICLGDIIGIGPFPEETVRRMMGIGNLLACVRGNHEGYLLNGIPARMDEPEASYHRWEHARLSGASRAFLASLPMEARLTLEGVSIYAAHYPLADGDFAPIHREGVFARFPAADVCLYGHDHRRLIDRRGGRLYADAGSLGCPGRFSGRAPAGILTVEAGTAEIEPVDVPYDADAVISAIRALHYPAMDDVLRIFYGVS